LPLQHTRQEFSEPIGSLEHGIRPTAAVEVWIFF
jgi:hypothetical protein